MGDVTPFPEKEYLLNEAQMLLVTMLAPTEDAPKAADARAEMIAIIKAWRRGNLLSPIQTPVLNGLYAEIER
jgi:hypothetical protein